MPDVLRVAVPVPLPQLFDYRAPASGAAVAPGCRVLVPFGRGKRVGIVVGSAATSEVPAARLKSIDAVLDDTPLLGAELLATLQWASRYYQYPLGAVLETALPVGMRQAKPLPFEGDRALALNAAGRAVAAEPPLRRGTRVRALFERLVDGPVAYTVLDEALPGWRDSASALRQRDFVETVALSSATLPMTPFAGPPLTAEQQAAIDAVAAAHGRFQAFLLEGVTGSGKT